MINVAKLQNELTQAAIGISGCNSKGFVWDLAGNEIQTRPDVAAIIAAHDPNPSAEELAILARKAAAKDEARSVTEIQSLTPGRVETWLKNQTRMSDTEASLGASIDAAITVDDLKPILKTMARILFSILKVERVVLRLLLSIRDEVMPDL